MKAIPDDRLYSPEHEWLKIQENGAAMGITDYAQCSLGDVVYVELPKIGEHIEQGKAIGVVESVKAVSDIFAPISGTVTAQNSNVIEKPELINNDPYGEGWLLTIEVANFEEQKNLINKEAYEKLLQKEAK
jgi:glycine cleavage system H protein